MGASGAISLRFEELDGADHEALEDMSELASTIVKEHFDPIIGPAQNDYMIARFQSESSIAMQLSQGYRYFFVMDEGGSCLGFLAFVAHPDSLYLSKFYLKRNQRGKGYAHQMMEFVIQAARARGFRSITLNVNRGNDARFAYEAMGFRIIRMESIDIGGGFFMDDYVYELAV